MRIAITSAVPGEGKSTVTVELAKAVATAGYPVTIIDADLHKPVLAERMGIQAEHGIVEYLLGEKGKADILYSAEKPSLSLVPCIGRVASPGMLFAGSRFLELLEWLEKGCALVLIDTPPLGTLSDASLLLPLCDGCIIVRSGRADERRRIRMESALGKSKIPVIGEIWNDGVAARGSNYFAIGG